MIRSACDHTSFQKHGKDRHGNQRYRCNLCRKTWIVEQPKPLGEMRVKPANRQTGPTALD